MRSVSGTGHLLAGDVGGTKTNLALFDAGGGPLAIVREAKLLNHEHADLADVVRTFLRGERTPRAAAFGIAGPIRAGGRATMPNLGWLIDAAALATGLGIERVVLLNDLEATGYGLATLAPTEYVVLNEGRPVPGANMALIAAGTGLGEAILFSDGTTYRVSPSEGGHADFAPRDAEQIAVLTRLMREFGHVSWERLVSGPGLVNLHHALDVPDPPAVAAAIAAAADPAAAIAEAALAGSSPRCIRALDLFVSMYGAEAGNLALKALATGGMWVAGGIAPKLLAKLRDGAFMRAFTDKGRFADLVAAIPVKVVLEPRTALRGAAAYLARAEPPARSV
jgi:glucokinase